MKPESAGYSSLASQASSMNSLSQAARKKQLHIARNILIFLGVVKLAVNAYFYATIDVKVNQVIQQQTQQALKQGKIMNAAEIAEATHKAAFVERIIWGGAGSLGVVFIFLGLFVKKYPVPMTVLSLLLYLISTAIFGILDPMSLMEVLFFKIFAVAALIKSIHAAIAYQRAESVLGTDPDRLDADFPSIPSIRRTGETASRDQSPEMEIPDEHGRSGSIVQSGPPLHYPARTMGTTVDICSQAYFSKKAAVFGFLGIAALLIGMLDHNAHWSLFSLAPWTLAVGLWFFRPAFFRGELGETGLCIENPPFMLPYARIQNMTLAEAAQEPSRPFLISGPLTLLHEEGIVRIPDLLNVPIAFIYRELFARIPTSGSRDVPDELDAHRKYEEAAFGDHAVFSYCSRRFAKCGPATGHNQARALLLMCCGLIWLIVGWTLVCIKKEEEFHVWIVFGVILFLASFLVYFCERSKQGRPKPLPKKFRGAGLVISSSGLCLHQEDLAGFLRWDEIRDVIYRTTQKSFTVSKAESKVVGLDLVVDGAVIRLADIYDRPLPLIKAVIIHFWKSPR
jgi:hypothetical protein